MSVPESKAISNVRSPCINICSLNEDDVCIGCYRSGHEITQWGVASEEERQRIMLKVIERERQSGLVSY